MHRSNPASSLYRDLIACSRLVRLKFIAMIPRSRSFFASRPAMIHRRRITSSESQAVFGARIFGDLLRDCFLFEHNIGSSLSIRVVWFPPRRSGVSFVFTTHCYRLLPTSAHPDNSDQTALSELVDKAARIALSNASLRTGLLRKAAAPAFMTTSR
jgi:hypothetical protein